MASTLAFIIIIFLLLAFAVIAVVSGLDWEQRARRAERLGWQMQQHLVGLGCRVVVERDRAACEHVRFEWPEINDFLIDDEPERIVASGNAAERTL
jgi:hypothetical protein